MKQPTQDQLLAIYEKMSQEDFDAIDPDSLTETAQAIYTKEWARRDGGGSHQSFPKEVSIGNKVAPSEMIDLLKTELGPKYDIWQMKQKIIIRENGRVGCSFPFTMDEGGNFSYGKTSADYSIGFSFLVSIPFIILMCLILLFLFRGILVFIALSLLFRFIIKIIASIPSKKIIKQVDEILESHKQG